MMGGLHMLLENLHRRQADYIDFCVYKTYYSTAAPRDTISTFDDLTTCTHASTKGLMVYAYDPSA